MAVIGRERAMQADDIAVGINRVEILIFHIQRDNRWIDKGIVGDDFTAKTEQDFNGGHADFTRTNYADGFAEHIKTD